MKDKKIIYVLVFFTLIVWGIIIYKIYIYMDEGAPIALRRDIIKIESSVPAEESFSLLLNYNDPFLRKNGLLLSYTEEPVTNQDLIEINEAEQIDNEQWGIFFSGVIEKADSNSKVALVKINNKFFNLKVGDEKEGYKILEITKDYLVISKNKVVRTLYKNQAI